MFEGPDGPSPGSSNGWFQQLVLGKLDELKKDVEGLRKTQMRMREDIVRLKMQSGLWGFAAGCIPVLIGMFLWLIKVAP